MPGPRVGRRFIALIGLSFFVCTAAVGPTALAAQERDADQRSSLERSHPYLVDLLDAFESARGLVYAAILSDDGTAGGSVDARIYNRVVRDFLADPLRSPDAEGERVAAGKGGATDVVPFQVMRALERADAFHRDLLNLYAGADGTVAHRLVGDLVREYGAESETSFPSDPKDMTVLLEGPHAGAFRESHPHLQGLMWAHRWLRLAAFEPLIRYQTPERRQAGITAVVARFWSMLEEPPETFPTEMPMAPTIAPGLVAHHVDAAAILDNAFMFQDLIANLLVSPHLEDRSQALRTALAQFQDPEYRPSSLYDWNRMAIIHGVGNQGGWVMDIIPRPTRTEVHQGHEGHGGHMVMPGMGPR